MVLYKAMCHVHQLQLRLATIESDADKAKAEAPHYCNADRDLTGLLAQADAEANEKALIAVSLFLYELGFGTTDGYLHYGGSRIPIGRRMACD